MAVGVRLKKSLNGGKSFGRRKSEDFDSNGNDSHRKHNESEERRSRFTEKKSSRRGGDSDGKEVGRKPGYTKLRSFGRNEYGEGRGGSFDSSRNDSYRRYSERGEKFSRRGRDSDAKELRRKPGYVKPRSFGRNEYSEGRGGSFDSNGNDSYHEYSERGERSCRRGGDSDGKEFRREPRGYVRNEYDESRRSDGASREMRGHRGKRDKRIPFRSEVIDQLRSRGEKIGLKKRKVFGMRNRKKRDGSQEEDMDENSDSVEASSDKFKLKWKKMDKKHKDPDEDSSISERSDRTKGKRVDKGDSKDKVVEENSKSEGRDDQVAEQKPVRHQTRVLNKYGKKIRVERKSSDDGSAERVTPLKKKKRVIKIDPYDISNKRLDDSTPTKDHAEKSEENESEISKNAQFRAIQPSPSILSFVEDNLLGRRRLNELKDAGYNIKLSAPLDNVPFSTSIERERIEDNVFRNKLEFFAAAKISSSFPPPVLPEIAFAGRSNVGKSSMLNALTRQWGVVRTSDKPGLTQTINFFKLASKLCLVDLPGYGFAYAKEEAKDAWEELVKEYVSTRVGLHRVCLLIDTKWGMKPRDHELIDLMERSQTPYQIVLTKTDLVFPIDVARRAMQIQESLKKNKLIVNPVMMASSKSGAGVRNLRTVLSKITRFIKP